MNYILLRTVKFRNIPQMSRYNEREKRKCEVVKMVG